MVVPLAVWGIATVIFVGLGVFFAFRTERQLTRAESELSAAAVADGTAAAALDEASRSSRWSRTLLTSPVTAPVRALPVVGRQLRVAGALSVAVDRVTGAAADAASTASAVAQHPPETGADRLAAVRRLSRALAQVEEAARRPHLGPDDGLFHPVASMRNRVATRLEDVRLRAERAGAAATSARTLLAGPSRYLLVAANNAEMRAGAGMFLSAGEVDVVEGDLTLGPMTPTGEMELDQPVPLDPATQEMWGWTEAGREWRNLQMWPQFDVSAAAAAEMWKRRSGRSVDGVLLVDVVALRSILDATGPVTVGGSSVGADDVEERIFVEQYRDLVLEDEERLEAGQAERREQLGAIASAAVERINSGDVDIVELARGLGDAAAGRHVMVWSRDPEAQRGWREAGVTGELGEHSMLLALLNRGGNKLDVHLDVEATIAVEEDGLATVDVRVANNAYDGLPPYVAGPDPSIEGHPAATYIGLVSLTVPGDARNLSVDRRTIVAGPQGPTRSIVAEIVVPKGGSVDVRFRFRPRAGRLVLEPSARVPPTTWHLPRGETRDDQRRTVAIATT